MQSSIYKYILYDFIINFKGKKAQTNYTFLGYFIIFICKTKIDFTLSKARMFEENS